MNRIQFWILNGISGVVVVLMLTHIFLAHKVGTIQSQVAEAQQRISQGQASQAMMKQIALRVFQDSQKTGDQGLRDLLVRQQISYNPGDDKSAPDATAGTPKN